jgi:hypothetical protein
MLKNSIETSVGPITLADEELDMVSAGATASASAFATANGGVNSFAGAATNAISTLGFASANSVSFSSSV